MTPECVSLRYIINKPPWVSPRQSRLQDQYPGCVFTHEVIPGQSHTEAMSRESDSKQEQRRHGRGPSRISWGCPSSASTPGTPRRLGSRAPGGHADQSTTLLTDGASRRRRRPSPRDIGMNPLGSPLSGTKRSMSDCVSANASLCSSVPTKAARSAGRST